MKITFEVDCTPEEARAFLGLPDVKPMQEALIKELQQRMSAGLGAMQPDEMLRLWLPANLEAYQWMADAFLRMGGVKRD